MPTPMTIADLRQHHPIVLDEARAIAKRTNTSISVVLEPSGATLYYGAMHPARNILTIGPNDTE
jgi:hypothetical protein